MKKKKYKKPVIKSEVLFDNIGMRCYASAGYGWYSGCGCS